MGATTKSLYDTDFLEWSARTAELLRAGRLDEVDLEHVAEEIEDLGKRDRWAVHSQMRRLLLHQIKRKIQPQRETASWRHSIADSQKRIVLRLNDSPSLKRFLEKELPGIYSDAVGGALFETRVQNPGLPERCPFSLDQLLDRYELDWPG